MPAISAAAWVAIGSLAVSAAAAYVSYRQNKSAARDQKEAQATSLAEQQAQVAAQKKAQVRQERIRKAEVISNAYNGGAGMSSGQLNATSDIGSLVEGNLGQMSRNENSSTQYLNFEQAGADASSRASLFQGVSSLAGDIGQFAINRPSTQQFLAKTFG